MPPSGSAASPSPTSPYAAAEIAKLSGLPQGAYEAVWRVGLLVTSILIAIIVLQNKEAVIAGLLAAPAWRRARRPRAPAA